MLGTVYPLSSVAITEFEFIFSSWKESPFVSAEESQILFQMLLQKK